MKPHATPLPTVSPPPIRNWSDEEIEDFLWGAGVYTLVGTQGFRKAATEAFMKRGYRLATISRDLEPFDYIHKVSLYMLGKQPRLGRREARKLARGVMEKIGVHPKPNECVAEVSGRRLIVSVALPHWAWPRLDS
jgi:hypothetical protein